MNYAVIMAGGVGTRFWPVSRLSLPKQLLAIGGGDSLLARTIRRIGPLTPLPRTLIVTCDAIAEKIAAAFPELPSENLLAEPLRRNTAPCAAVAAKLLVDRDPDAAMALLPADHVILKEAAFQAILGAAFALAARADEMIALGITPRYAETGYGYIEMGERLDDGAAQPYCRIAAFHEKPEPATAERYLASGRFLWNAGIYVFRAAVFLQALKTALPELHRAVMSLDGHASPAEVRERLEAIYPATRSVSIDTGVMEKVENLIVFPADIGWSDVGSWTALREFRPLDARGNAAQGDFIALDAADNTVFAQSGLVAAVGVEGLIIVHTPDATLVARRDDAQAVKKIFDELEKRGWMKYLE
jgi:mannose-1-phosphate guanylyltransferase